MMMKCLKDGVFLNVWDMSKAEMIQRDSHVDIEYDKIMPEKFHAEPISMEEAYHSQASESDADENIVFIRKQGLWMDTIPDDMRHMKETFRAVDRFFPTAKWVNKAGVFTDVDDSEQDTSDERERAHTTPRAEIQQQQLL